MATAPTGGAAGRGMRVNARSDPDVHVTLTCTLVTNDAGEFARIEGLVIENWLQA